MSNCKPAAPVAGYVSAGRLDCAAECFADLPVPLVTKCDLCGAGLAPGWRNVVAQSGPVIVVGAVCGGHERAPVITVSGRSS